MQNPGLGDNPNLSSQQKVSKDLTFADPEAHNGRKGAFVFVFTYVKGSREVAPKLGWISSFPDGNCRENQPGYACRSHDFYLPAPLPGLISSITIKCYRPHVRHAPSAFPPIFPLPRRRKSGVFNFPTRVLVEAVFKWHETPVETIWFETWLHQPLPN